MFERKKYKKLAKLQLKNRMTTAVLAILVSFFLIGITEAVTQSITEPALNGEIVQVAENKQSGIITAGYDNYFYEDFSDSFSDTIEMDIEHSTRDFLLTLFALCVEGIVIIANCYLFNRYYLTPEKISFKEFLNGLSLWFRGSLAMLWYTLWVFLWSLLLIIPGLVKAFSYSQMFFIIAENPLIGINKAMKISKIITRGYKMDIFVMCLSFIGWELLSILTLGILQLWLKPYELMTFTNAYKDLKTHAIRTGLLTPEDFI